MKSAIKDGKPPRSTARTSLYEIRCFVNYQAPIPRSTQILKQLDLEKVEASYLISVELSSEVRDSGGWTEPPHKVFANLPDWSRSGVGQTCETMPIDPAAAQSFIEKYGPLHFTLDYRSIWVRRADETQAPSAKRPVTSDELQEALAVLRRAWNGDPDALGRIRNDALQNLVVDTSDATGAAPPPFQWRVTDLWNFICILFLKDYAAAKLGQCANPECRAYFIKPRRTQKVCEREDCLHWAQKKVSLDWWNQHGRAKRATKAKRRSNSKRRTPK